MDKRKSLLLTASVMLLSTGCVGDIGRTEEEIQKEDDVEIVVSVETVQEPEVLDFVDVYGKEYQVEINPDIEKHTYDMDAFVHDGDRLSYTDKDGYDYWLGVDVSKHQGTIDWEKVKAQGYEFAIIRVGYKGYGEEGLVCLDQRFHENIQGAQAAGVDVGVYFFAQAINEEDAREEAQFVLENLEGYELQLPVVYDPESILDDVARTDNVSGEQFTANTVEFCRIIKEAGYQPMIYSNMLWEAYGLNLEQLSEYPIWYADYEPLPQTPYHFEYWQYTNSGYVDGIEGRTDLNIQLIPTDEAKK